MKEKTPYVHPLVQTLTVGAYGVICTASPHVSPESPYPGGDSTNSRQVPKRKTIYF